MILYEEAIKNPNCPPELVAKYMKDHEEIEKFNELQKKKDEWLHKQIINLRIGNIQTI